jgi:hypothetical protein
MVSSTLSSDIKEFRKRQVVFSSKISLNEKFYLIGCEQVCLARKTLLAPVWKGLKASWTNLKLNCLLDAFWHRNLSTCFHRGRDDFFTVENRKFIARNFGDLIDDKSL